MVKKENSTKQRTIAITAISLVVALFSPAGLDLIDHPYGEFAAILIGAFWEIFIGSPIPIDGGEMVPPTFNPAGGILAIPLITLRLLFVLQIYRAYNGQTSRRSAILWGVLSELYLVILNLPSYITAISTLSIAGLYLPLPILLAVGVFLVWIFPPFVPSTPWEVSGEVEKRSQSSIVK